MKNDIRIANINDLEAVVEIYNQAIASKFETADTTFLKPADRVDWFANHTSNLYPIYVYELDKIIAGWISISPYRPGRNALRYTAEISYYVHTNYKRQGIGSKLIEFTLIKSKKSGLKTLFAILLDKNQASINLLSKHGFSEWGHMPDVADFDGIECGHVYYGRRI